MTNTTHHEYHESNGHNLMCYSRIMLYRGRG